jgi:hypothetical protein
MQESRRMDLRHPPTGRDGVRRAFLLRRACLRLVRKSLRWPLIAVAGILVGAAALLSDPKEESSSAGSGKARIASSPPLSLPQRQGVSGSRFDLFDARSAASPAPPAANVPAPPAAPGAPPNPYRFVGTARFGGSVKILLARGDVVVEANEGEMLDELYRVRTATDEGVTLVYLPLGIEQAVQPSVTPPIIR